MDGAGDAYDNLETLLNSVLLFHYLRNGELAAATKAASSAPSLFFDASMDCLLKEPWGSALRAWREQNRASPELLKCIWEATDPRSRPSPLALFEVALSDEQYGAAESALTAFSGVPSHKSAFSSLLDAVDSASDSLYVRFV